MTPLPQPAIPTRSERPRSKPVADFDAWIRGRFVELNSELESLYEAMPNRMDVGAVGSEGEQLKSSLVEEGRQLIVPLLAEGNTDEGFERTFELLGNVGYYMAACRRHEVTEPSRERTSPLSEASALALHLSITLGTAPRFVTSHMETHNRAIDGVYRTFTDRTAETVFLDYNTRSMFAYKRAADALVRIQPMGISHTATHDLLTDAKRALDDALALNVELAECLEIDDFYFCVRPYYKPYRVGSGEYRGANAGDFAAFNEIDLLLGLCSADDPSYASVVLEKYPYLTPSDQLRLRDVFRHRSMLDQFLENSDAVDQTWYAKHAKAFLAVCEAHGRSAAHHHDELVHKFIAQPSTSIPQEHLSGITASGPPLNVLLAALEKLRDQRLAADRPDIKTRFADLQTLRRLVGE